MAATGQSHCRALLRGEPSPCKTAASKAATSLRAYSRLSYNDIDHKAGVGVLCALAIEGVTEFHFEITPGQPTSALSRPRCWRSAERTGRLVRLRARPDRGPGLPSAIAESSTDDALALPCSDDDHRPGWSIGIGAGMGKTRPMTGAGADGLFQARSFAAWGERRELSASFDCADHQTAELPRGGERVSQRANAAAKP